jgi:hypothetical protein
MSAKSSPAPSLLKVTEILEKLLERIQELEERVRNLEQRINQSGNVR